MSGIKAIVVDDEASARNVLSNLLARFCDDVDVVASCADVNEAVAAIKEHQPDVVFLDIEMPQYAGYEIVNFFEEVNFEIIFVTAYNQYAVRAFEVAALDYLLKPVNIQRLKSSVDRVRQRQSFIEQPPRMAVLQEALKTKEIKNLVVSDRGQQHVIPVESIIAIEAQESYCMLHTSSKTFVASKNLKHFENSLEGNEQFFRVHKSWMINKNHLIHYSKSELTIQLTNSISTKLSKYRKAEFESFILD